MLTPRMNAIVSLLGYNDTVADIGESLNWCLEKMGKRVKVSYF